MREERKAGTRALYCMMPTWTTSKAKTAAARGVPKRAEKAAAMPQTVRMRPSAGSSFRAWAILLEMAAPS